MTQIFSKASIHENNTPTQNVFFQSIGAQSPKLDDTFKGNLNIGSRIVMAEDGNISELCQSFVKEKRLFAAEI